MPTPPRSSCPASPSRPPRTAITASLPQPAGPALQVALLPMSDGAQSQVKSANRALDIIELVIARGRPVVAQEIWSGLDPFRCQFTECTKSACDPARIPEREPPPMRSGPRAGPAALPGHVPRSRLLQQCREAALGRPRHSACPCFADRAVSPRRQARPLEANGVRPGRGGRTLRSIGVSPGGARHLG